MLGPSTPDPASRPTAEGPFRLLRVADAVSLWAVRLTDLMLIAIAAMLTYEVIARYVFRAPSRWTSDVATTLMISLTFLAMAYALRNRAMVRITALVGNAPPMMRKLSEGFSLLVIVGFALLAATLCLDAMMESIRMGRRQPTMLRMPNWVAEAPVVIGFSLLALQGIADLIRLPWRPAPDFSHDGEAEFHSDQTEDSRP